MKTNEGVEMPIGHKRVTIGIPSYNEEENISNLVRSIIEHNKLENQSANHDHDIRNRDKEDDSNSTRIRESILQKILQSRRLLSQMTPPTILVV